MFFILFREASRPPREDASSHFHATQQRGQLGAVRAAPIFSLKTELTHFAWKIARVAYARKPGRGGGMTYDEHCKLLDVLAEQGLAALDHADEDAALLYVTALIDLVIRHGDELRRDAPPVDQIRLQEMKRLFRPILQAIEERLGPRKSWQ
jgi:hypothetical protein